MKDAAPQLALVALLVALNATFAGSELALVSLREGQLKRLELQGRRGATLARLARDPNRFLATIQIGITLAGFLASASASVSLAKPLEKHLAFLGDLREAAAILLITLVLSYVTLVFGELAPKRIAMQRAEAWGLWAARPLAALASATRPAVWVLSRSADLAVRVVGADPDRQREEVTDEDLRDLLATRRTFTDQQRTIMVGAFEVAERRLNEIVTPRRDVVVLDPTVTTADAISALVTSGHSRAPVAEGKDLDEVVGVVHLRDLVGGGRTVRECARRALFLPNGVTVLDALRQMRAQHEQLAVVLNEHGGADGIVTVEDLVEEFVGEIYDESDRDVLSVSREPDGSLVLPGRYPIHDLADVGVDLPPGDYVTVAGLLLDHFGRIPRTGEAATINGWTATVLDVDRRAITRVRLRRRVPH